jgi:hypothetical protein
MKKGEIPSWNFPFLVRQLHAVSLFDALQPGTPSFWARWLRWRLVGKRFNFAGVGEFRICLVFCTVDLECHTGAIFPRINRGNTFDGYRQFSGHAAETGLKFNEVVPDQQFVGSTGAKIKNDLAISDELARHASSFININRNVGSEAVVAAPLPDGAQQIGLGRRKSHALFAHCLFGRRQRVNETLTAENALGVLHQRCSGLAEVDPIVVQTPK